MERSFTEKEYSVREREMISLILDKVLEAVLSGRQEFRWMGGLKMGT